MNGVLIGQVIVIFLLVGAILLQPGESGFTTGSGLLAGGENYHTRRGFERFLFWATFGLIALFAAITLWIVR